VLFEDGIKAAQVAGRHVKPFQGVEKALGWKVPHQEVEHAEGPACLPRVVPVLNRIKGPGILDEGHGPPKGTVPVDPVVLALPGPKHPRNLEAAAFGEERALQPPGDVVPESAHVGHDLIRRQEHPCVHPLKDEAGLNRRIHGDEERVMDIAVSVLTDVQDCTLELEPAGDGMLVFYCGMVPKRFNRMSSGPDDVVMALPNDGVWALCRVR
jgi:hypothetical protein